MKLTQGINVVKTKSMRRVIVGLAIGTFLLQAAQVLQAQSQQRTSASVDWSKAVVESTMKRYPTASDLGSWGYAKALFLVGEYMVWKRTGDGRYLQYIRNWVD